MITGGTGSFGNALLRKILCTNVGEVRIFSRDEKKQNDMRTEFGSKKLKFHLGDVRDYGRVLESMRGVDFVFHAAALKQVPSCEFYPMEAVRTNVIGTENVLSAASSSGVKRVVVLSTDKAVYPINAMGITKAMAEKVMVAKSRIQAETDTVFCATRYGNVLGSRGSVIPLFISQIKEEKPLTITDPNMTRFLMSLEDSVALVLHAFENGRQGDIFVQKAPACSVAHLAQAIQEVLNYSGEIKIIGTRHGEKLFESLVSREEMAKAIDLGDYLQIPADNRDLNYAQYFTQGKQTLSQVEDYTSHNAERLNVQQVKEVLLKTDYLRGELNA